MSRLISFDHIRMKEEERKRIESLVAKEKKQNKNERTNEESK